MVEGKSFRLADEVRYIQRRAADRHGRVVTVGQLVLLSTETGDAWLLDPSDQLAARLARDGDPEPVHIEDNERPAPPRAAAPSSPRRSEVMARDDRPSGSILRQAKADQLAIDLIHHCEQAAMRRNPRHCNPAQWKKSAWRRYLYAAAHAPSLVDLERVLVDCGTNRRQQS